MKSVRLLSHQSNPLAPLPDLSNLGSRIALQSPTGNIRFGSPRNSSKLPKKGTSLTSRIRLINCNYLKDETFHGNINNNQSAPVTCKDKINISVRLHSISKEIPTLQRSPNAERTTKSFSAPLVYCVNEVSLLHRGNFNKEVREFNEQASTLARIPQSHHIQANKI